MAKKKLMLVMLAVVLALGMTVVGCEEEPTKSNDENEITLSLRTPVFSEQSGQIYVSTDTEEVSGLIVCSFMRGDGLTVSDLSWVTKESFSFAYSGPGDRTVTIDSIEKQQYNNGTVDVVLSCTRTAGYVNTDDYRTATVAVTAGGGYTVKWTENRHFTF
jgi:hypothetical protein